jgi:hypothetical protein
MGDSGARRRGPGTAAGSGFDPSALQSTIFAHQPSGSEAEALKVAEALQGGGVISVDPGLDGTAGGETDVSASLLHLLSAIALSPTYCEGWRD